MTPLLAPGGSAVERSFERLYRRYVADVYRYSFAVLRNQADAEDVTQTTFLNAYRAYQRGERPDAAQNWLIAIAHNVCRQRFRQSARRPEEVEFDDGLPAPLQDEHDGPSAKDIQRALGELAFNQRAALVMRELEGRSYGEIAEILELSVSAVETLIFRARRALREQLEGALTCSEAERAVSKGLDGRLSRSERAALRGHLRRCDECASFARSQRAQRGALKALATVPLPPSLATFFGGGGAAATTGAAAGTAAVVVKIGAFAAAAALVGGVSYEGIRHAPGSVPRPAAQRTQATAAARASASETVTPAHVFRSRLVISSATGTHTSHAQRAAERGRRGAHAAHSRPSVAKTQPAAPPTAHERVASRSSHGNAAQGKPQHVSRAHSSPGRAKHASHVSHSPRSSQTGNRARVYAQRRHARHEQPASHGRAVGHTSQPAPASTPPASNGNHGNVNPAHGNGQKPPAPPPPAPPPVVVHPPPPAPAITVQVPPVPEPNLPGLKPKK